jgi:hypothetical protein
MTNPDNETTSDRPFGTVPRRPVWPLVLLIVLFVAWFAFLLWMAIFYPARP